MTFTIDDQTSKLNTAYAVKTEQKDFFPVIMAENYKPSMRDNVGLCLLKETANSMDSEELNSLELTLSKADYGDNTEPSDILTNLDKCRFVILAKPQVFALNRETNDVSFLKKGVKLSENNLFTVARVHLCILKSDNTLVMDATKLQPQIFTLKLKSLKTKLVDDYQDKEASSIVNLNKALQKACGQNGVSMLHLASVRLIAKPTKFTSSKGKKESSIGVMFAFEGGAKILSEENQQLTSALVTDNDFIAMVKDPFGIRKIEQEKVTTSLGNDYGDREFLEDDVPPF